MPDAARPRRFASVRVRTTLAVTLVVAAILVLGAFYIVREQREALRESVEQTAELRGDDLAAALDDGTITDEIETDRSSFVQIVDDRGRLFQASDNVDDRLLFEDLDVPEHDHGEWRLHLPSVGNGAFAVVGRYADNNGRRFTIFTGTSLEHVDDDTAELARTLAIGVPLFIVLAALLTWIVVGRALKPVDAIRSEVDEIGGDDLHRRVPEPGTGDEIDRLAHTMNAMLARVEESSERQRRFVADASHELRSPLTGIRAQLEVDLSHPERADWEETQRDVLGETMRLQRLVDDLLVLAQSDENARPSRRETIDLDDVVLAEARRLRVRGAVDIDAHEVSAAQVEGDRDALTRVVRNLLDNAERHARSAVSISVHESSEQAELQVSDDGPGIPPELRDRVFERFTRADDARDRASGGTGLGLAIAQEIVIAHGGTIEVASNGAGGATFVVRLPLAAR